ncbi:hypothetical protein HO173_000659 [Letharia columbiana]|uniref:Uncharacterized protein n=1 Tax=Letharia columbiana TaxID=112416 RepID=A0A8H6G5F4_9LECA|nr:uncharacterized protein HO173_000659 [Letharia columbiana]KAF6240867.1 hypothetical protein HO173_000659 [Letharia columbiana]
MLRAIDAPFPAHVQTGYSTEPKAPEAKDRYEIPIPKKINYIWLGRTFEDFDQTEIQACVKDNPDYRVRLWLDDFSMLEMEGPSGLPRVFPRASLNIYTSGMNKAISSTHINKTFAMLVRAQMEFYKVRLNKQLRAQIPTVQKFQDFLQQNDLHNVDLLFLSDFYEALFHAEHQRNQNSLCYPSLQPSSLASRWDNLGPEVRLLQWALFERYRGNYAAASNLLRVQLLQTYPGIYVDHHTTVPSIGDITGFRFALTAEHTASQSFLASAPNHPCLQYFRYCILQNYDSLLRDDFKCVTLDYTTMKKPTDPSDFQNPYFTETYSLSGPGAFFKAMKDVAEGVLGENVDISKASMKEARVNARVAKGCALDGGKDTNVVNE